MKRVETGNDRVRLSGAVSYTARELWERGRENIPEEFVPNSHLIYSSPATLSFNSPGAEGFGVKRAGLSVPGSVMLIVSPGCCGRNTSSISSLPGYENRFFYLTLSETDLITGRHLKRIPAAVREVIRSLSIRPSVVMICITCVDALLGTDMERVCRKAEEAVNDENLAGAVAGSAEETRIRVRPCYMYALTREGRKPPMVNVRQSIYSLLEPRKKKADSVNLLGYFAPVYESCELRDLLRQAGVKRIREVSSCREYDEFQRMAEANFNLILNPEARPAARDLEKRLGIPSIELTRLYQIDQIGRQYDALGAALGLSDIQPVQIENQGVRWDYSVAMDSAKDSMRRFRNLYAGAHFSVGEALNGDPFEMALALVRYGFYVDEIFGTVTPDSFRYLRHLAVLSPDTRVYSNIEPSMLCYGREETPERSRKSSVYIALGKDAVWYHPDYYCLEWGEDEQPFGFDGVKKLFDALLEVVRSGKRDMYTSKVRLTDRNPDSQLPCRNCESHGSLSAESEKRIRGFRRFLTPFAPDQSGAVSVLYELGGITVICDAGGCTGNICGFDEPRWFRKKSALFSAGLRDMDAILGRDDKLVEKLASAVKELDREKQIGTGASTIQESKPGEFSSGIRFAAVVGTPVPAVIGTDFHALECMVEKKTGLPSIGIVCDGMEYYDVGAERTYLALLRKFCGEMQDAQINDGRAHGSEQKPKPAVHENVHKNIHVKRGSRSGIGVWGADPIDYPDGFKEIRGSSEYSTVMEGIPGGEALIIYGSEKAGLQAFREASRTARNLVVSVSGLQAAKLLQAKFEIPYICFNPFAEQWLRKALEGEASRNSELNTSGNALAADERISGRKTASETSPISEKEKGVESIQDPGDSERLRDAGDYLWRNIVGRKILVVHEQVTANSVRKVLLERGAARVDVASWFMMKKDLLENQDFGLDEEADFRRMVLERQYDVVFADSSMRVLMPQTDGGNGSAVSGIRFYELPHFAVSGKLHASTL